MEAYEFGTEHEKRILLIPDNMMSWRQFEDAVPILADRYHVIAISTDGYDGSGNTTFTTSKASAASVEKYLKKKQYDSLALVFGESFGCATAVALFHNQNIRIDSMILSGPQYMSFGILNGFFKSYIPKHQYKLSKKMNSEAKVPWMLKAFTHSDDTKMLKMFRAAAENVSQGLWGNTWRIAINPRNTDEGVCFELTGCPLADYAKTNGYENLLPYMCAADHLMPELVHAKLIRTHTCATGSATCDYWYVDDESETAKAYADVKML